ncbi:MAG TPA: hypothetical protein GXZ59_00080 [Clostridiaceae bacterium]|nr:hypothetical protein [Clostridiaceae bacterium]
MAKGATEEEVSALLDAAFNIDGFNPLTRPAFPSSKKTITVAGSGKKGLKTVSISSLAAGDCHGGSDCGGGCGGCSDSCSGCASCGSSQTPG